MILAIGVAGVAWVWTAQGDRTTGIAILGDEAPALHAAMGTVQALPVGSAAVTIVSVAEWDRLRYISDMARLCGQDCTGPVGLVRTVDLAPTGSRVLVFVNLGAWTDPSAPDLSCLARAIPAAARADALPDCTAGIPVTPGTRWVLPFGLGAI